MRKRISLLMAALLVFSFAGCSQNNNNPPSGNSGNNGQSSIGLLQEGTLQIGVELGYPPLEYYADDGKTETGYDVDMARAICQKLGLTPKFIDTQWDGIFAGLSTNKYDVVISAVTINADRRLVMDFTNPYVDNWQAIVVRTDHEPVEGIDKLEGLNVGYQGATTSQEFLEELIATGQLKCNKFPYEKVMQTFDDLKNKRIDCALVDSVVAAGYVHESPDLYKTTWIQSSDSGAEVEQFGIAVKKGNTALVDELNKALAELQSDGTLDKLKKDYALIN